LYPEDTGVLIGIRDKFMSPFTKYIQELYSLFNDPDIVYWILQLAYPSYLKKEFSILERT